MPTALFRLLLPLLAIAAVAHAETDPLQPFAEARMDPDVPTLRQALGHSIAERYTRHDQLLDYCEALAQSSDRVRLDDYGRSHLDRRLITLTISSPDNLDRLDEILEINRMLADPEQTVPDRALRTTPAIVWFSFSVHGNEGSNVEAALALAYALAASQEPAVRNWLDDVVVVIDPCLNPDGRERYVSWFETVMGKDANARRDAAERFEPWPGGRTNHYLFDLNRDWVWGVHPESRSRVAWYRKFLPHLHIDWHEQGYASPAFFGEGDTPYSANIPQETKDWIADYTVAVAEDYDALGLVYSTRERFDYLYPGYGKVLPCYHGAVGILNEQGGHSRGGLAIEVDDGYTLTLAERVRNQLVIARAYIEHTAKERRAQLDRFRSFFTSAMQLSEEGPAGFLVAPDARTGQLRRLWDLCELHGIHVHRVDEPVTVAGVAHDTGERRDDLDIAEGAWWIPVDQPMGRLVLTLFERSSFIEDPDTYDITGWSVPLMFGIETWALDNPVAGTKRLDRFPMSTAVPSRTAPFEAAVGTLVPADQWDFPIALGIAARHALFARLTGEDSSYAGLDIPAGSLLLHTIRTDDDTRRVLESQLTEAGLRFHRVDSGLSDAGPVLGANANRRFILPHVMLPRGDAFSSYSFGQIWHMLDVAYPFPHTVVPADRFGSVDTDHFNVLVLPSGRPSSMVDADALERWVREGGTVVAMGASAYWASRELLDLENDEDEQEDDRPKRSELTYAEREARSVEDRLPGAVFRAHVDVTHPIGFGCADTIGVIKRSSTPLPVADNGYVVARFADEPYVGGAASQRNIDRIAGTPFVTHHTLGGGNVICFSDDITLRGFNHAGMRLLVQAIAKGPSFARTLQPLGEDELR
ncbi:MAG: M14 family metallopeptidase [Phycisphaerales bacterium]